MVVVRMHMLASFLGPHRPCKIGYNDVLKFIDTANTIIINTLPVYEQDCLIEGTMSHLVEEARMNELLHSENKYTYRVVIYGKHATDDTVESKYQHVCDLGIPHDHVYMYCGGMFEWMLLQDIFGAEQFPTTSVCRDVLRFQPKRRV